MNGGVGLRRYTPAEKEAVEIFKPDPATEKVVEGVFGPGFFPREIADYSYGFTAGTLVLQSELLLISRDREAIERYLPNLERACEFIESARDPKNDLFLVGPGADFLAPAYGAVRKPDGSMEKAYLAEVSVSYLAALDRMVELYRLTGDKKKIDLYEKRRKRTRKSIRRFLALP